jgi:7,8-dihydropterin-6-yl-methyl-4-(beta-D-ribofuranosyl)aminobenzene 5'-phosphate synthase
MFVKILYDNKGRRGFKTGHGFSCLVNGKILFDAGEDAESLLDNMARMKVSLSRIEAVVISHDHWDHSGGLWEILKRKKKLKVYACPKFSDEFKTCVKEVGGKLILADKFIEISNNIYVTGQIGAKHKGRYLAEQALVVRGKKGISVITGCAHPGISRIVKHVERKFETDQLYMVFGGFHLHELARAGIDKIISEFKEVGVTKAGPSHCTGDKAVRIFKGQYGKNFVPVNAGSIIEL